MSLPWGIGGIFLRRRVNIFSDIAFTELRSLVSNNYSVYQTEVWIPANQGLKPSTDERTDGRISSDVFFF